MTGPSTNELMQEGIQQVREGQSALAYNTFKQVVARDPRNEFGWIWVSVTSPNRSEKRQALQQALQINPGSQHAKEALRNLDAEEAREMPATPPPPFGVPAPAPIGQREVNTAPQFDTHQNDSLRAALADNNKKKAKPTKPVKEKTVKGKAVPANVTMVSRKPPQSRKSLFILAILVALIVIVGAVWFYIQDQNNKNAAQQAANPPVTTVADTVGATDDTITATAGTTVTNTPIAVTTPQPTTLDLTAASNNATPAATTSGLTAAAQATPAPGLTTASSTTAPATTTAATTSGTGTPTGGLPTGTSQTSQIAHTLQTAQASQTAGDYKGAIAAYQQALQMDPTNVPANLGLGNSYLRAADTDVPSGTNRYESAVQAFKVVTSQASNWSGGYALLGEALANEGQTKPAIDAYSQSLQLDPNGPERWLALASLYDKDNQPDQAKYARQRASGVQPTTVAPTTAPVPTTAPAAPPKAIPTATPKK